MLNLSFGNMWLLLIPKQFMLHTCLNTHGTVTTTLTESKPQSAKLHQNIPCKYTNGLHGITASLETTNLFKDRCAFT